MADEDVEIVWTEQGGPDSPVPAGLTGYGSSLVQQTIEDQLSGSVTYDWTNSGAVVRLRINGEKMSL